MMASKDILQGLGCVLVTIALTVYGQLVIKWQVLKAGAIPAEWSAKFFYFVLLFKNPWVLSGFCAAFLASIAWMAAMTKLPLSFAYPFTSIAMVLVVVSGAFLFKESVSMGQMLGCILILLGIILLGARA
jgi:multidrug transporter EmrE-like cation transporter